MFEPMQPTFVLYYLILPVVIGSGIDMRTKNRFAFGAGCGIIFYLFMALWFYLGPKSTMAELEPVIILITSGLGLLIISFLYESKRSVSLMKRQAVVFLAVSVSGLPLYMIKIIIDGKLGLEYPASLLPLFQFTLALVALVVIANVLESQMFSKNEGRAGKRPGSEKELFIKGYKKIGEKDLDRNISHMDRLGAVSQNPQMGHMGLGYDLDEGPEEEDWPNMR